MGYNAEVNEILLRLKDASVRYGSVTALQNASIAIDEGEIVALMGPNGAGKTTVIKSLFGIAPLDSGQVLWHGQELQPIPHEMPSRGIAYVPQGRQVFKNLTVRENLELGGYALPNRNDLENNIQEALRFFPALKEKMHAKAGELSGGQQQMLTIARGLISDPRVLLLDEPSLGLAPKIVKEVFAIITEINAARKIAVLIVEHSITSVLSIAHRAYILSQGKVVAHDTAQKIGASGTLKEIFLAKGN